MSEFIERLEAMNAENRRVRAVLRRSLAFEPGAYVPAYPYVERFVRDQDAAWRREMLYLVAGLWAEHWREGARGRAMTIGEACAAYQMQKKSASTESRFINLLDSDADQLPNRLRQMVSLLKDYAIDFEGLLKGLQYWNGDQKRTQNTWARDFYRNMSDASDPVSAPEEEATR